MNYIEDIPRLRPERIFYNKYVKKYLSNNKATKLAAFDVELYQNIEKKKNFLVITGIVTMTYDKFSSWAAFVDFRVPDIKYMEKEEEELIKLTQKKLESIEEEGYVILIHGGGIEKGYFRLNNYIDTETLAQKYIPGEKLSRIFSAERYGLKTLELLTGFKRDVVPYYGKKRNYFVSNTRLQKKLGKEDLEPVVYCLEDCLSTLLLYIYLDVYKEDFRKDGFLEIPVTVGDEIELYITGKAARGDGLGKFNRFVIIVKGAEHGKKYRVRITETALHYAFGEIIQELG